MIFRTRRSCWILLALIGCACSSGGEGESAAPRRFLSLGTAPPGGAFFVVGGAMAGVLNEGSNGRQVTAEATKGSQENIRRLISGELDVALANAAISYFAVRGAEGWDREYPIRAVMTLAPNVALFVAGRNAGIESVQDLRGKRVVLGPSGAGFDFFLRPLLAAHGLTYDDLSPLHGTQAAAVGLLADGSASAAFLGGAVPTASITQAASSQEVAFVPFDEVALDRLTGDYVFFSRAVIPAGTYPGQDTEFSGMDMGSMHLIAAADADEELIYELTRILWEKRDKVTERHPAGRAINERNVVRDTGIEFHPGAIRYYREIGIWTR